MKQLFVPLRHEGCLLDMETRTATSMVSAQLRDGHFRPNS
jgi:hypothetical protein